MYLFNTMGFKGWGSKVVQEIFGRKISSDRLDLGLSVTYTLGFFIIIIYILLPKEHADPNTLFVGIFFFFYQGMFCSEL